MGFSDMNRLDRSLLLHEVAHISTWVHYIINAYIKEWLKLLRMAFKQQDICAYTIQYILQIKTLICSQIGISVKHNNKKADITKYRSIKQLGMSSYVTLALSQAMPKPDFLFFFIYHEWFVLWGD